MFDEMLERERGISLGDCLCVVIYIAVFGGWGQNLYSAALPVLKIRSSCRLKYEFGKNS